MSDDRAFWDIIERMKSDERDPIELAASDMRVVRAARYVVLGLVDGPFPCEYDYTELLSLIRTEYLLSTEGVMAAMDISEDRVGREH